MSGERERTIKLFCPSLSKEIQFVALAERRLDLGSIARAFGLDSATLKLNGYFISRGVDLIASSVTWKSLLSYFSSRGLSTGETDAGALIVDGKLAKVGTKRAHDTTEVQNWISVPGEHNRSKTPQLEEANFPKIKKLKESNSGHADRDKKLTKSDGFGLKRKQCLEDIIPLKRMKVTETNSGGEAGEKGMSIAISNNQGRCSFAGDNTKRIREDDMVITARCKKTK